MNKGEKGGIGNRASASQFKLIYSLAKVSQKDAKENYLALLALYKEMLSSASRSELNKYYAKTTEIHLLATKERPTAVTPQNVAPAQILSRRFNPENNDGNTTSNRGGKKFDSEPATNAAEITTIPSKRHTPESNKHFITATLSIALIAILAFTFLLGPEITGLSSQPTVSEGISPSSSSSTNAFDWKVPDSLVFFYHWLKTATPTGLFGATIVNETIAETIVEPATPKITPAPEKKT